MTSCPRREVADVDTYTVANRGPASSADIADRLFQLFVTTRSHGVRVRLSICRTIIESHGSHIVVETTASSSTILKTAFAELSEET
ncbi:ATP-binding protein [Bradyrhizobium sp. USDA 4486]